MFKHTLALLATISLLGAGCSFPSNDTPTTGNGDTQVKPSQPPASSAIQGSWKMLAFKKPAQGEKQQDVSALNLTLTLGKDGELSAKICNSMGGSYSYQDGKLQAPQVQSTLMFCEGLAGEIESAFTADLAGGMTANAADGGMTMIGLSSLTVYMFAKQ